MFSDFDNKTKARLLSVGAFCVGGTLISCVTTNLPQPIIEILKMFVGSGTGIIANDIGGVWDRVAGKLRGKHEILSNDDLAKAVGTAIAAVIAAVAKTNEFPRDKLALQKLAKAADESWSELKKIQPLQDQRFEAVEEAQLAKLFTGSASEVLEVRVLKAEDWRIILDWLGRIAAVRIEINHGEALGGVESRLVLGEYAFNAVVEKLQTTFVKALREVIKEDAESGGQQFASLMLSLLGEIYSAISSQHTEILQRLDAIALSSSVALPERDRALLESLSALLPGTLDSFAAIPQLQEAIRQEFADFTIQVQQQSTQLHQEILDALKRIETGFPQRITDLLEDLKTVVVAGFTVVQERLTQQDDQLDRIEAAVTQQRNADSYDDPHPSISHFQGRAAQQERIRAWLADGNVGLIGIIGIGGFGKSTLAAKIFVETNDVVGKFWADLTLQRTFTEFAQRVLMQLGNYSQPQLQGIPEQDLPTVLVNILQKHRFLLVVDNLESVLTTAGEWQDSFYRDFFYYWLDRGDNSNIIVTSREIPTLPAGNKFRSEILQTGLSAAEGAALLRSLGICGEEAELQAFVASVAGFPLSLMLVAGLLLTEEERDPQISALKYYGNLYQIAGLHRGQATITVDMVLTESLNRLSPAKQQLLLKLSVYRRPFNAQAASFMEETADHTIEETLKDLRDLARRSLLIEERDSNRERWFSFQPIVQQYLQQKAGDQAEAHQQAIDYYRFIAVPKPWQNLEEVTAYVEAFYHYCQLGEYQRAYSISNSFDEFLRLQGANKQLVELYTELIQAWQPTEEQDKSDFAWTLTRLGSAYESLGQYQSAIDYHQQSLAIFRDIGDHRGEAASLNNLGNAYDSLGQYQRAIDYHQRALAIKRDIGDRSGEAISLNNLGNAYYSLGQYQSAIDYHQQSLAIFRDIGDRGGEATSLNGLGIAFHSLGQYQRAIDYHQQSLAIKRDIGDRGGEAISLNNLGTAYKFLEEYQIAIDYFQQSLAIFRHIGDQIKADKCLQNLSAVSKQLSRIKQDRGGNKADSEGSNVRQEQNFHLNPELLPNWLKQIGRFAQQGRWQLILCFVIGLFAFPFALVFIVARFLWFKIRAVLIQS